MAKNIMTKKQDIEDNFDFSDMMESDYENDIMTEMFGNLLEASHHHMRMAFDLTKLIVEKDSSSIVNEEQILGVFKRASKAVADNLPLKPLWEKLSG